MTETTTPAPFAVCAECGRTALGHEVTAHKVRAKEASYAGPAQPGYTVYDAYCPGTHAKTTLEQEEIHRAMLTLTCFISAPKDYKPSSRALKVLHRNESEMPAKKKAPKRYTIYLVDGRYYQTLAMARQFAHGREIRKATTAGEVVAA